MAKLPTREFGRSTPTAGLTTVESRSAFGEVSVDQRERGSGPSLHATPLGTTNGTGIIISSQSSAPGENAIVSQSISVVKNTVYTLTFAYQSTLSVDNGGLQVLVNGTALTGSPLPGTLTLTNETLTFTATTTGSETLAFENNHTDNNTPTASVNLNGIVITAAPTTPEPSSVIAVMLLLIGVCEKLRNADGSDKSFGRCAQTCSVGSMGVLKDDGDTRPFNCSLGQQVAHRDCGNLFLVGLPLIRFAAPLYRHAMASRFLRGPPKARSGDEMT